MTNENVTEIHKLEEALLILTKGAENASGVELSVAANLLRELVGVERYYEISNDFFSKADKAKVEAGLTPKLDKLRRDPHEIWLFLRSVAFTLESKYPKAVGEVWYGTGDQHKRDLHSLYDMGNQPVYSALVLVAEELNILLQRHKLNGLLGRFGQDILGIINNRDDVDESYFVTTRKFLRGVYSELDKCKVEVSSEEFFVRECVIDVELFLSEYVEGYERSGASFQSELIKLWVTGEDVSVDWSEESQNYRQKLREEDQFSDSQLCSMAHFFLKDVNRYLVSKDYSRARDLNSRKSVGQDLPQSESF